MKTLRTYDAQETGRMHAVHGKPLASFTSRAGAFVIDFLLAFFIFLGLLMLVSRAAGYFGIRVVSLVHNRMSLWHSFERALGYGASFLEFGFGFLQYFIHPNRRTVHDRIAETIVIHDRMERPVAAAKSKK